MGVEKKLSAKWLGLPAVLTVKHACRGRLRQGWAMASRGQSLPRFGVAGGEHRSGFRKRRKCGRVLDRGEMESSMEEWISVGNYSGQYTGRRARLPRPARDTETGAVIP